VNFVFSPSPILLVISGRVGVTSGICGHFVRLIVIAYGGSRITDPGSTSSLDVFMLIVLSGLPGVGKTTIARGLARATGAVHIRIDSIEQALRNRGHEVEAEGYDVGYVIAADNLRLGRTVVADCVNPWALTREAWRSVASRAGVRSVDVEIVCSDVEEHRRRVESRAADIPGHQLPAWSEVRDRDYHPWTDERIVVDTTHLTVDQGVHAILSAIGDRRC